MKRTKAIIAATLISSALFTTSCGKLQEVDPFSSEYLSYEIGGISGYTGYIQLPTYGGSEETLQNIYMPSYHCDCSEPLSNGDTITIQLAQSEELLKKVGYKVTRTEMDITISGLEELPETLPNEAADSIITDLKESVVQKYADEIYSVGDMLPYSSEQVKTVGEMQFVRGLYEVTTKKNAEDSPFQNEDSEDNTEPRFRTPPKASFKALWSMTYEIEYTEDDTFVGYSVNAGDTYTKTDYLYASIDGFTIKDGQVHYDDHTEPLRFIYGNLEDKDYTEYITGFDSLSDKEHLARVEY